MPATLNKICHPSWLAQRGYRRCKDTYFFKKIRQKCSKKIYLNCHFFIKIRKKISLEIAFSITFLYQIKRKYLYLEARKLAKFSALSDVFPRLKR